MRILLDVAYFMRLILLFLSASIIYVCINRFLRLITTRFFDWIPQSRKAKLFMVAISVLFTMTAVVLAVHFYVYNGLDYQPDIYRIGNPKTNFVALTFDDGPSCEFTPSILDILKEHNVHATFFMVGIHAEKYPDVARRVAE